MAVDIQALAAKLKQARELQSFPQHKVAEETGIAVARLTAIEAGKSAPGGDEVLILANLYRHDFRDFLVADRVEPFKQTDILYRRFGNSFTGQDRRAIQEFLFLCEIESYLEKELLISKTNFNFSSPESDYKKQAEAAAQSLRATLDYALGETRADVFADFRRIGIHVFRRKLAASNVSGLYIEHPVAGHCVLVNYEEDLFRQRFSVSHEAAHMIFDSSEGVTVSYQENAPTDEKTVRQERRANHFASCYLMPTNLLPKEPTWDEEKTLSWAKQFHVSTSALSYALYRARRVTWAESKEVRAHRLAKDEKVDPEAPDNLTALQRHRRHQLLERGLSDYYVGLCFDAHQKGIISTGRLSEALLSDYETTCEISVLFGRAMNHGI